ncbi:hypothetical protein [Crocosphaera chwakensis]|uniref:Uncharacterized protein n=1 Tax=Crocosphaera chwakensis CCY0110 TaxID=391612 RepID=A3IY40_9CHRO|nr:hypothetical protein [Crocosphaera chwakensis]EAZ88616.1 hypothetical protein CY0110_31465 [Crocosphaera chwakensis CCY0110]
MNWSEKFKEKVREIQKEKGRCLLRTNNYAFIDAVETRNNKAVKRQVHWICEQRTNGYAFILLDGVTGHESWYVDDLVKTLSQETDGEFFTACFGCSNYPKLELDLSQMRSVIMQLHSQFN